MVTFVPLYWLTMYSYKSIDLKKGLEDEETVPRIKYDDFGNTDSDDHRKLLEHKK
jgi:hypothetical protein